MASVTLGDTQDNGATIYGDGTKTVTTNQLFLYNTFKVTNVIFDVSQGLIIRSGVGSGFVQGKLINRGAGTWHKGSTFDIVACDGFILQNEGIFDIQCDRLLGNRQSCDDKAAPQLVNKGTVRKSVALSALSSTDIWLALKNSGTIEVDQGILRLAIPASTVNAVTGVSSGNFVGSLGTSLRINGPNEFTASSSFNVDEIEFNDWGWNNGSISIAGRYVANTTSIVTGQLKVTGFVKSFGIVYMRDANARLLVVGPQHIVD